MSVGPRRAGACCISLQRSWKPPRSSKLNTKQNLLTTTWRKNMRPHLDLPGSICKKLLAFGFMLAVSFALTTSASAQTEVTGAIEGRVTSSQSPNGPVAGATVQITNLDTQVP